MSLLADAVTSVARVRRRRRRGEAGEWMQRRLGFIREHAPGRSFADIGGMYGIDGEIALRAEEAGATEVTLFDAGEPTPGFLEQHRRRQSRIRCVQGDLEDPVSVEEVGPHDIVWCVGVIYHTPNPVLQLMHLRKITRELLFIGSATIPEIPGFPQACVYYPYLARRDRAPYARGIGNPERSLAVGTPFDDRPMYGHGNFWWGITPSAMRAMLETARFEVVEEVRPDIYPWGAEFVARPVQQHPSLPPVDYFRRRGERLKEGHPLPFDGYYDKGPDAIGSEEDMFPRLEALPEPDPLPHRLRRWRRNRS
jgi:SAM-dependent methyltransferase